MKFFLVIATFVFLISSCATIVSRTPHVFMKQKNHTVTIKKQKDIFKDFLWSQPPSYAQKVYFTRNQLKIPFKKGILNFTRKANGMIILRNNKLKIAVSPVKTTGKYYYNLDELTWRTVYKLNKVLISYWVTENRPITNTKVEYKKVPVQKKRQVYDADRKAMRTEFYTDWENQSTSKSSIKYKDVRVMKTKWVNKQMTVASLIIPSYTIYHFDTGNNNTFLLYKIVDSKGPHYYFQNISYYSTFYHIRTASGKTDSVKLIFLDGNQNGKYDDPEDYVLFNTRKLKNKRLKCIKIGGFASNQWINLKWLAKESFISIKVHSEKKKVNFINANNTYLQNKKRGRIKITGLPEKGLLRINGKQYKYNDSFNAKIEYGHYKVNIHQYGCFDKKVYFVINKKNPVFTWHYEKPDPAVTLKVNSTRFETFKFTAKNSKNRKWFVFNKNRLTIPPGKYLFILNDSKNYFIKTGIVKGGEIWIFDQTEDKLFQEPHSKSFY